jgi:hypothetical protein
MIETKSIDRSFWETKHENQERYWLTGSDLMGIMHYHNLTEQDFTDKKVLEIGVGLGNLSKEINNFTNKISCCDISENALNNLGDWVTNKCLTQNLNTLEAVDLAVCHLVFQHCVDSEVERIINDVNLTEDGIFSFQFAYIRENESPNMNVKNLIDLGSHHFRTLKTIEKMVEKANKEIIWVSNSYDFYTPENFSWLIVKIKNKK